MLIYMQCMRIFNYLQTQRRHYYFLKQNDKKRLLINSAGWHWNLLSFYFAFLWSLIGLTFFMCIFYSHFYYFLPHFVMYSFFYWVCTITFSILRVVLTLKSLFIVCHKHCKHFPRFATYCLFIILLICSF